MRNWKFLIFCIVLVCIQLAVLDVFFGLARMPNLVLAAAVCLAVYGGFEKYLGWIILLGIFLDAGSSRLLGSSSLSLVVAAFSADKLNAVHDMESRSSKFYLSLALVTAISLFIFDWAGYGLAVTERYLFGASGEFALPAPDVDYLWKSIFTVLGGFGIYFLVVRMGKDDVSKIPK